MAQNRALAERVAKLEDDAKRAAERRALAAQKVREELAALGSSAGTTASACHRVRTDRRSPRNGVFLHPTHGVVFAWCSPRIIPTRSGAL